MFLVGTGMRPEEALALEWRDIDNTNAVASIERVHSQGRTKPALSPIGNAAACRYGRRCWRRWSSMSEIIRGISGSSSHREAAITSSSRRSTAATGFRLSALLASSIAAHTRVGTPSPRVDRGRCAALLPLADHGNVRDANRRDVRAPCPGLRGVPARTARRIRRPRRVHERGAAAGSVKSIRVRGSRAAFGLVRIG